MAATLQKKPSKRSAIVTGGAGGIGLASIQRLIEAGFDVLMVDVNETTMAAAVAQLPSPSSRILSFKADVTDPRQVDEAVALARREFGRIDALINVAGGAGKVRARDIDAFDLEAWNAVMDLNVTSTFLFSRAVAPIMREQRYGRIVNLSSVTAMGETGPLTTVTGRLPYATAKAALVGFTKQLAKDLGEYGITVNALLPGLIVGETGTRIRDRFEGLSEDERNRMTMAWPMGRPGMPDEVAVAIAFLASEGAGYISGVALPIDGAFL
jgi:NAD(P)-dependent dehydrogenase (short-subunit alcohol dehydrogenase family)